MAAAQQTTSPAEPRSGRSEVRLALMLARQATTRWQFDASRFADAAADLRARRQDQSMVLMEAELQLHQIETLRTRLVPLAGLTDLSISFEAQELVAALTHMAEHIEHAVDRLRATGVPSWRSAADIAASFRARLGAAWTGQR